MPSKSKAQQRFMGMVHAYKKGELKGSEVSKDVKDAAKGMKKKDTKKYASTKHKGLPNKVKKEELKRLIAKYGAKRVRETVMAVRPKAVTVSGNRMPEDPDFEYDPEKVTDEGFGGELKGKDKDKFEKARIENAEQLGYKATGTSDTKKQKLKMAHELKEVSNPTSGIMMAHKKKKKHKHNEGSFKTTLRPQKKDINKMKVRFKSDPRRVYTLKSVETGRIGGTSYMFAAPGNRKERFTPKTWDLANKKGWLSLESVNERKNPKREKTKKSFLKNLQKTEKTIRRIKQFAKSNQWGPISNFVEDDLVYDMTALKNDIDTIISLPVEESVNESYKKIGKKVIKYKDKTGSWNWDIESGIDTDVLDGKTPKIMINYQHKDEKGFPKSGGNFFWLKEKDGTPYTPQKAKAFLNKIAKKNTIEKFLDSIKPSGAGNLVVYKGGKFVRESVNEAVEPTGNIKKVLDVAKNKQAKKIGGTLVDATTANMMTQVWDKVNDSSKEKMNKMNTKQLINLILRMWKAMGTPRV